MATDTVTDAAETDAQEEVLAPLGGTRAQAVQRLQIGMFGLVAMLLLVGLATIIRDQVQESQAAAVPEAASTVSPVDTPAPKTDPLADAGVVPELPSEPVPAGTPSSQPEAGGNGGTTQP